jgi:hypothetical protein
MSEIYLLEKTMSYLKNAGSKVSQLLPTKVQLIDHFKLVAKTVME